MNILSHKKRGCKNGGAFIAYDVEVRDRRNRRVMILETKKSDSKNCMEYWCQDAIRQIAEKEYAKNLDGYDTVLCYSIAFYEKSAKVMLDKEA